MTAQGRKTLVVLLVISAVLVISVLVATQFLIPSLQKTGKTGKNEAKTSTSSQNPLDQLSNPFSGTYQNPFDTGEENNKEYKNPFDSLR